MAECDREEASECNKKLKAEEKAVSKQVLSIKKKMTAGKLVVECRSFHLNKNVLTQAENRQIKQREKEAGQRCKDKFKYMIDCHKAGITLSRNNNSDPSTWKTSGDLLPYLRLLKRNDDSVMPTKRAHLEL